MTGLKLSLVISAVDRATAPLKRINDQIQRVTQPIRGLRNQLASAADIGGLARLTDAFSGASRAIHGLGAAAQQSIGRTTKLLVGAGGLSYLFNREFIGTADTFERLDMSLQAIEGSAEKAAQSMAFIKRLTVETPFEVEDIAKVFRMMRGFGMDPTNGSLRSIADQVAKVGGNGDNLTSIAMQLGQAFGKGRLMAQDMNILVENNIPVWALLQRYVERVAKRKVSVAELRQMSESGKLGAKALNGLIEQMGLESAGASQRMMRTWSGMLSNLRDQWTFFKLRVMSGGALDFLKARLSSLLDTIERMAASGALQHLADRVGRNLVAGFKELIAVAPQVWAALRGTAAAAKWLADAVGGWRNVMVGGLAVYIGGPLVVAFANLTAAIVSLGLAIGFTPIGWFLAGVALIGLAAFAVIRNWKPMAAFFRTLWADIRGSFMGFTDWLNGWLNADSKRMLAGFEAMRRGADAVIRLIEKLQSLGPSGMGGVLSDRLLSLFGHRQSSTERDWLGRYRPGAMVPWRPSAGFNLQPNGPTPAAGYRPGDMVPFRPPQPAADSQARVTVDFKNLPRGTRVTSDPRSGVPLDLSLGYAMADAR